MQAGREIKFRAWDNVKDQMYYLGEEDSVVFTFNSVGIVATDITENEEEFKTLHHLQYMQFTGLRDKNDREIYEGDILGKTSETSGLSYRYTVEWDSENARFMARGKHFQELVSDSLERCCEVIGNVWEDGGLLNDRETSKAD
ncbi:YopX family protein [Brevibacillus sp. 1238]|uniref:YopX family protein n=1 Tax=Brevibacillus sp. 1238 TaxID=2940565 RepID=UPI002474E7D0|nr:YopX family protein [Brevibacillus sp. 1238]MDH6351904.1 putative phage protein (TIGR01671 family) [Brevibacillus sp. 1238]